MVLSAPAILPVILLLGVWIAIDGSSPFYAQKRVGRGGRHFRMWKLRSMVKDADDLLERHLAANPDARAEWKAKQKLSDDPRITPAGKLIRKTSLDELPQLWNVLTGDMSLVGPRPMMTSQTELYPGTEYFSLRPGITGNWQVSERNKSTFAGRARYDAAYSRDLTLTADIRLLLKTVSVVFRGTGC